MGKKRISPPSSQLSWLPDAKEDAEICAVFEEEDCTSLPHADQSESHMIAMREWLLAWGEANNYPAFSFPFASDSCMDRRYGLLYDGKQQWLENTQAPHSQRELYVGEWLVKAIEHVKRFDKNELTIPWKLCRGQQHEQEVEHEEW